MQEWLKDKKNLPIVAGLGVTVLVLAVVAMLFEMGVLPPQSAPPAVVTATNAPPQPVPGGPSPNVPGAPPVPAPNAAAPGSKPATASAAPVNVAKGLDPFKVPIAPLKIDPAAKNAMRVRNALPPVFIQQYTPSDRFASAGTKVVSNPAIDLAPQISSNMRMSGVVFTDNAIKAILETNGVSQQVQPGDLVDGGRVVSIQADGLTMRTADSRLVRVPLSSTSTGATAPSPPPDNGGAPPVDTSVPMPSPIDPGTPPGQEPGMPPVQDPGIPPGQDPGIPPGQQ